MATQPTKCTYERIIFVKKIPYWIYWFLVGLTTFFVGEIISRIVRDNLFFWDRLIFAAGVTTVPTVHIWLFYSFEKTMKELFGSLWERETEFEYWLESSKKHIFTLHPRLGKIVAGLIVISGIITVMALGIPFGVPLYNVLGLLAFALFLFMCGQALYITIALLLNLAQIVRIPVKVPFYLMPITYISKLQNYYLALAFSILSLYVALVLAVWQGPYGFHPILLFWLTVLAFYPLSIFFASSFQIHNLMRNIKNTHLKKINDEVQRMFEKMTKSDNGEDVERLEKLMDVQEKIQNMRGWPFFLEGTITFVISLLPIIVQASISFYELSHN